MRLYREVPNPCELIYNVWEEIPEGVAFQGYLASIKIQPFGVIGKVELSALHSVQKYLYLVYPPLHTHTKDTSL